MGTETPRYFDEDGTFYGWGDCVQAKSNILEFLDKTSSDLANMAKKKLNLFEIKNLKII